jgi:hypothetical protein
LSRPLGSPISPRVRSAAVVCTPWPRADGFENEGFNDAKNRYGLEHIRHHHERSLVMVWLLTCLALTLERLYRLRYLHRGLHLVRTAIDLFRLLLLGLSIPVTADSS